MSGKRARSNRRLINAANEARELAGALRDEARFMVSGPTTSEDRDTAAWLNQLASTIYGGARALPVPDTKDLERATAALTAIERRRDDLVRQLRDQGLSWTRIGYAVGLSDEGARKRWTPKP